MQSISNDRSLILFQTIDIFRLDNTKILKYIFFGNYKFHTIVLVIDSIKWKNWCEIDWSFHANDPFYTPWKWRFQGI